MIKKRNSKASLNANEKDKQASSKSIISNGELVDKLSIANAFKAELVDELATANAHKDELADELIIAKTGRTKRNSTGTNNKIIHEEELVISNIEKAKRAAELVIEKAKKAKRAVELVIKNLEKAKRSNKLIVSGDDLNPQIEEEIKQAAKLVINDINITNRKAGLVIANIEKAKHATELVIKGRGNSFQTEEKSKIAAELVISAVENAKHDAALIIASIKKAKHSAELVISNVEKAKRSAAIVMAKKDLVHQKNEKSKRAIDLIMANVEKAKYAAELIIANIEKAKRAAEFVFLSKELVIAKEKEKLVFELVKVNKELNLQINERNKTEETLLESERKYRGLVENSPDAIIIHQDRKIVFANKESLHLLGAERIEELTLRSFEDFIHPDYLAIVHENWKKLEEEGTELFIGEERFIRLDGKEIDLEVKGMLIIYENKKAVQLIIRNITERKLAELELIKAKEKAEESDRLKSAFLANMSHEIRTPMNGILGFTELLKEPNLSSDDQQDFLQIIQISGARMLYTINNIVDISKIESGITKVDINETNINEKIEFTYKFFKPEAELKGLNLIFKNGLNNKEAIIKTDNEKVYGILTNLLKNAIKFTYEGLIEFGYEKKGPYLEFYVKDTGIGIPNIQKELIFQRFRQGNESPDRMFEGSGLGLTISKSYIEMLGGKIWVESEEGIGSTFYFTIPYIPVVEVTIENKFHIEDKEDGIKNLKILIVEDDEISYSLLTRTLQKISTEVLHAISGVQAIEACRNNPDLDLVLMDIRMPLMDGNEATRQIRQFNKDIIIIAQTAYSFTGDREKAMLAGCNDYISKPVNRTLLFELIKKHIKK